MDLAVAEDVAAVLLAGDVVEDEHDFFEAYSDLRSGAERLADNGIQLVAIVGNHDVTVLPRLAQAMPTVRVLGIGGRWEAVSLERGGVTANVVGWSWPAAQVTTSPLGGLQDALQALAPAPTLGLLHCDLDQTRSVYAPVRRTELPGAVDAWLLGHVHKPSFAADAAGKWCGYLGSAFGADPGEEGPRGAWLLTVADGGLTAEHVPLSPLLYDTVEVDVSHLAAPADVSAHVAGALEERCDALAGLGDRCPVAVGVRLRLVGSHELREEVEAHVAEEDPREGEFAFAGTSCFVHDVSFEVYPRVDVAAVAATDGPRALMARRLMLLDGPPCAERERLIGGARAAMLEAVRKGYKELDPPELTDDEVAATLRSAAAGLLARMMEMAP